jgi:tRNA(Ile)-lysidine synthase
MSLPDRFLQFIKQENLFQPGDSLLLAVSGGVDSVVLCELCHLSSFAFRIAHCNFKLRGEESERDEKFVERLAKRYQVEFLLKQFDTNRYASENKLSIQEAARKLRYDWFHEIIDNNTANTISNPGDGKRQLPQINRISPGTNKRAWIVTAHHSDDNLETMLLNFFRGTGIQGLRGMKIRQGKIVRPLLQFRKEELITFANDRQLTFVEDSSNESRKYSRNYFRHEVIPLLKTIYPEVEENLMDNLLRFRDIETLYNQSIEWHKQKLIEQKGSEIHIPILKLQKSQPIHTIIHEIIKPFGFTSGQVAEVIKLLNSETGKYIQSVSHRIIKNRKWIIITPKSFKDSENVVIDPKDSEVEFQLGQLQLQKFEISTEPYKTKTSPLVAELNASSLQFPLLLRKWRPGDYFYPLGMRKKKKLSRFFIDQKLSKADKENIWVLEMRNKILWVVGMRIDDRFKITDSSASILSITLKRQ